MMPSLSCPTVVLLDMDGTLTVPRLDFGAIKRAMGIGSMSILEAMRDLTGDRLTAAMDVLDRHESIAAVESELAAGAIDLLQELRLAGVPTALVTRNSMSSARTVVDKHRLKVDAIVARECSAPKPDAESARVAIERLGLKWPAEDARRNIWMVGDGEFDIQLAHAASLTGIWLSLGRDRPFPELPDATVQSLYDLINLLRLTICR